MNLIGIDFETGGLNPTVHGILSIGAYDLTSGRGFEQKVIPGRGAVIDPIAAKMNGYDWAEWLAEGVPLAEAVRRLAGWVDTVKTDKGKPLPVAHHSPFEEMMVRVAEENGISFPFARGWRCSRKAMVFMEDLAGKKLFTSHHLEALAFAAGIWTPEQEKALHHGALPDAEACVKGYAWLLKSMIRPTLGARIKARIHQTHRDLDRALENSAMMSLLDSPKYGSRPIGTRLPPRAPLKELQP